MYTYIFIFRRKNEIIHGFEFEDCHPPGDHLPPNGTGPPYGPASVYAFIDGCLGKVFRYMFMNTNVHICIYEYICI
jgi:hypothetical protein